MVRFYKILKTTIAIIVITTKTAPASPTPAAATNEDYWKDHVTLKCDKWPQSNQPLKWKYAKERPSRLQVIQQWIELITSHTKRKPPPVKLNTAPITKTKKKRTKPNTKKHTKQEKRTLANFATPKRKHSPQWLRMSLRIKNTNTKNIECNNHAKPLSRRSMILLVIIHLNPCNQMQPPKPMQIQVHKQLAPQTAPYRYLTTTPGAILMMPKITQTNARGCTLILQLCPRNGCAQRQPKILPPHHMQTSCVYHPHQTQPPYTNQPRDNPPRGSLQ